METTLAVLGLVACGIVGLVASGRAFLTITAVYLLLLAFGSVGYRYAETGETSLVWEAGFRATLFGVTAWGARALSRFRVVDHS